MKLFIIGITSLWGLQLGATTIYNNEDLVNSGSVVSGNVAIVANHFGTDANSYTLTSISLELFVAPGFVPVVNLYTDSSGAPGTLLSALALDTITPVSSGALYKIVTVSIPNIVLSPSTDYWVTLQTTSWKLAALSDGTRVSSTAGFATSGNGGSTWTTNNTADLRMDVEGTIFNSDAPEPGTMGLAVLALVGGMLATGRRRIAIR